MTSIIKSYEQPFKDWSPGRQEQWKRGILKNILEINRYPISVEALSQGKDIKPESIVNVIFGALSKSTKDFPIPLEGTLSPTDAKGLSQGQDYAIFLWNYYFGVSSNAPSEKKEKAKSFISGATSFRPGKTIRAKTTSISSIIPKKTIPQQIAEKISSPSELGGGENEPVTNAPRGVITSLGRLTLNLEQSNNNLEKIIEVVKEDYKTTKETNKKEIEDYRKRVANRGRILGKKELGSDKVDLSGIIKKYVGSFFSGTGGAIRALAGLNLIEGIMTGDPMKILGSLTGITASYLPAIGMVVGGKVAKSLGERLFLGGGRRSGGIFRGFGGVAREAKPIARLARGGGRFALGAGLAAGALAIGGKIFGGGGEAQRVNDMITSKQESQGGDLLMPEDLLKKFDDINDKFERAVNRLLSGGTSPNPTPTPGSVSQDVTAAVSDPNVKAFLDVLAKPESGGAYNRKFGGGTFDDYSQLQSGSTPFGRYQFKPTTYNPIAQRLGITDVNPASQDIIAVQYMKDLGVLDEIQSGDSVKVQSAINRLKGNTWTGLQKYKANEALRYFGQRASYYNKGGAPPPVTLPSVEAAATLAARRNLPAPSSGGPTIVPLPVSSGAAGQNSESIGSNDVVPTINTNYPENFLALYSKLIYQIV